MKLMLLTFAGTIALLLRKLLLKQERDRQTLRRAASENKAVRRSKFLCPILFICRAQNPDVSSMSRPHSV